MKVSGEFQLIANFEWSILNLEEIRIDCNTSEEPCIILLPPIDQNQGRNAQLFVNFDYDFVIDNYIVIVAAEGETINGEEFITLDSVDGKGVWIQIQDDFQWAVLSNPNSSASAATFDVSINFDSTTQLSSTISGGIAPFTYQWSTPQAGMQLNLLSGPTTEDTVNLVFSEEPTSGFNAPYFNSNNPTYVGITLFKLIVTDATGAIAKDFFQVIVTHFD